MENGTVTEASAPKALPYGAYGTFVTTLDHYGAVGIPNLIDRRTLPPTLNGSSKYEMLACMKQFRLISDGGIPNTERFKRLIDAKSRKDAMTDLLKEQYASLFALPLATAGPTEITKWFEENTTPSTVGRARAFFLAAAKQNGIPLHSIVAKGTRSLGGSVRRKRRSRGARVNPSENGATITTATHDEITEPGGTSKTISLKSGAGEVTLSVSVDLMDLEGADRAFVFGLIDDLKKYEKE